MITVLGSGPMADGIVGELRRRGRVRHVPLPAGSGAEPRVRAIRRVQGRVVVAATGEDERSVMAAALAKRMGASVAAAVVESGSLAARQDLASALKVDRLINPQGAIALAVLSGLIGAVAVAVQSLGAGRVRTTEVAVNPRGRAAGLSLRDLALPAGSRVAVIRRGDRLVRPTADTVLEGGDRVVLVANRSVVDSAAARLGAPRRAGQLRAVVVGPEDDAQPASSMAAALGGVGIHATIGRLDALGRARQQPGAIVLLDPGSRVERRVCAAAPGPRLFVVRERATGLAEAATELSAYAELARAASGLLPRPAVERVGSLVRGALDVYRVETGERGRWLGTPLRDLPALRGWTVLALQAGRNVYLPHPEDVIGPGEVLIIAGPPRRGNTLRTALCGR